MKPFTLTCASCNARLAVRDGAVLGQVVGCPQCGSKVKVVAPAATPHRASPSVVEEERAQGDETIDDSQVFNASFDDVDAALTDVSVNRAPSRDGDPNSASPWEGMVAPSESLPPDPTWGMSARSPWRRRALLAAPVLAGIVLVISVWGLLTLRSNNIEVAEDQSEAQVDPSEGPNEEPDATAPETTSEPVDENEVEPPAEPSVDEASPIDLLPGDETGDEAEEPEPVEPLIPDEEVPTDLDLNDEISDLVDQYVESEPFDHQVGEEGEGEPSLPNEPSLEIRIIPVRDPVDVAARLAYSVEGIDFPQTPLNRFVDFVIRLSPMPITVDPEALLHAGVPSDRPISVRLVNTTAGAILEEGVASVGLTLSTSAEGVVIVKAVSVDGLRLVDYSVDDLTGDDPAQCEALASLLREMVYPESWAGEGGQSSLTMEGTTLRIAADEPTHFESLLLLERLRLARGLGMRSELGTRCISLMPRAERAAEIMAQPIELTFIEPTPLLEIARRLEEASGAAIFIDWVALAELGWTTRADATLSASDIPLRAALEQILAPMQLTWRLVDQRTIQITTVAALVARPEIEVYRVGDLLGEGTPPQQLLADLERAVGEEYFLTAGGSGGLHYDEPSGSLIVLLPQPQQIEVAAVLARWRQDS